MRCATFDKFLNHSMALQNDTQCFNNFENAIEAKGRNVNETGNRNENETQTEM